MISQKAFLAIFYKHCNTKLQDAHILKKIKVFVQIRGKKTLTSLKSRKRDKKADGIVFGRKFNLKDNL